MKNRPIVSVTEMSFKMASQLCQNWLTISCQKAIKIFYIVNFVQIVPACGPNTSQIMYGEILKLPVSASAMVTKKA